MPPQTLLQQLELNAGSLALLTVGARDAPARQHTLDAAINWSYDLLEPDERTLFRRLAPFHGATLDAVARVCVQPAEGGGTTTVDLAPLAIDARTALASLVDKNLVHLQSDDQGEAWFVLLETVRDFALERLQASPESDAVWRRFAWYYLRLAELSDGREAGRQDVVLNRLEHEHANFRAALDWCQAHGYAEASLRLAVSLLWFWAVRGHLAEGRRRFESLLARFPLRVGTGSRAVVHGQALDSIGRIAALQADLTAAEDFARRSLELYLRLEYPEGVSAAMASLGAIAQQRGDLDQARAWFERSVAVARSMAGKRDDPTTNLMLGHALGTLAQVAHEQGDDQTAIADLMQSIHVIEANGDRVASWPAWLYLARVRRDRGEFGVASEHAETALRLLEGDADRRGLGLVLAELGSIATAQGQFDQAYAQLLTSLKINLELGERGGIAFVLDRLTTVASGWGQHLRALRLAGAAARLREQAGSPPAPLDQQEIDRNLETSKQALGRFAQAAVEEGRTLGLAEVLTEVNAISVATNEVSTSGRPRLTSRERQVALLVASGRTNRQIAGQLVVAEGTVATHVQHILAKLELRSRAQIAAWAVHEAVLEDQPSQSGVGHAIVS
jgi:DNA-binding CsgD family transcriptional regulator/tetratricopeptide (TPR) repeat protein